jgi:hypothetical protein
VVAGLNIITTPTIIVDYATNSIMALMSLKRFLAPRTALKMNANFPVMHILITPRIRVSIIAIGCTEIALQSMIAICLRPVILRGKAHRIPSMISVKHEYGTCGI